MKKNRVLFLMVLPAVLLVLVLSYLPMSGLILAFKNYRFDKGVFGSDWNGLENFRYLFSSGTGWLITKNTILYNLLNLITSQGLAIVLAIIISEMQGKIYKKVTQSIIFLPYFISWVIVGAFVYNIFNYETGLMNGSPHWEWKKSTSTPCPGFGPSLYAASMHGNGAVTIRLYT